MRIMTCLVCCLAALLAGPAAQGSEYLDGIEVPADATYVGSEDCTMCHEDVGEFYTHSPHAPERMLAVPGNPEAFGCEACHGPGSLHVDSNDPADIMNPATDDVVTASQTCLSCHRNDHPGAPDGQRCMAGQTRVTIEQIGKSLNKVGAFAADYGQEIARQAVGNGIDSGITELDVVQIVQQETTAKMRRELTELINFYRGAVALTAHTGARGALPHGQPGPVPIRPGDTLIVGIGVKVGGYHAESGCTYVIGEPTADQQRCLDATWACDEAALAALYPGIM